MNVLLTDFLTCPRCGPAFGLVLLAQEVRERRVLSGELGCPNCRDRFQVTEGFADLRAPPRQPLPPDLPEEPREDGARDALQIAAALGVPEGPGFFVFLGAVSRCAAEVAGLVKDMEVVTVGAAGPSPPRGVSPIAANARLPFRGGARGVVLDLEGWARWGAEAVRVVATAARVVVTGVPLDGKGLPSHPALQLLLSDGGFAVFQKGRDAGEREGA